MVMHIWVKDVRWLKGWSSAQSYLCCFAVSMPVFQLLALIAITTYTMEWRRSEFLVCRTRLTRRRFDAPFRLQNTEEKNCERTYGSNPAEPLFFTCRNFKSLNVHRIYLRLMRN